MAVAIKHFGPAGVVVVLVVAAALICTLMSTKCERIPLVPVTRSVKLPVDAPEPAFIANGELDVPPDGGVIGDGSAKVTSAGAVPTQEPTSITAEVKAFSEVTVMLAEPLPP